MGCWNGTCALSNLSITYNDRVVVLLLVNEMTIRGRRGVGGGVCGTQTTWRPFHIPLRGTYDDYGCAELDESQGATDLFNYFQGDPFKSEKFRFHGREFDFYDYNVESASSILKSIERGIIQVKINSLSLAYELNSKGYINEDSCQYTCEDKWCGLGFMMMHESIYDTCVNNSGIEDYLNKLDITPNLYSIKRDLRSEGENWIFLNNHPQSEYIKSAYRIQSIMRSLRKLYSPQGGARSQDDNMEDILVLNEATNKIIENRKTEYEEE